MTLLEQLDRAMPDWRTQFASPLEAALELGLIEPVTVDEATSYKAVTLRDEAELWANLEAWHAEYAEEQDEDE